MAQHQLPLNSLCVERGGGPVDEEADGNNFLGASPSGTYEGDMANNNNSDHQCIHNTFGHTNSFHSHYQPVSFASAAPPYKSHHQNQDDHCLVGSNTATSSGHALSVRTPPPLSGSLPPITSLGKRSLHQHKKTSHNQQLFGEADVHQQHQRQDQHGNGSSGAVPSMLYSNNHQQQQQHNSSGASSGVCSPASPFLPAGRTPMQPQQQMRMYQQQSNGGNEFTPLVRMGGGNGAVGQHQHYPFRQQQQYGGITTTAATNAMVAVPSPIMAENHHYSSHHHSQLQKQLPSPAFSNHGMNNTNSSNNNHANSVMSSNPGSIISALPESPLSAHSANNINANNNNGGGSCSRSPSVRSNYSLQRMLVNSASTTPPDQHSGVTMLNNNSSQPNCRHNSGAPLSGENSVGRAEQQPTSSSSLLMLLGDDSQHSVQNDSKASSSFFHHHNSLSYAEGDSPLLHNHSSNSNNSNSGSTTNAGKAKRTYSAKTARTKNSVSATLPLLQQSADTFSPSFVAGDIGRLATVDGPTVRQHLQQQQAAQRQRQQHEAMVRRLCQQQRDESASGWSGGEKLQQNQQQMNMHRRRPQIESAPPSVTTNVGILGGGPSPCSFPPSVPSSSSAALCGGGGGTELQQQILMVSAAPSLPPLASKTLSTDSLTSPSKRGGRSRAAGTSRAKTIAANSATTRTVGANSSTPGASSADTLANTIASVASGGGSFEFEKAIGTSPLPSSLSVPAGTLAPGDPSGALLPSTAGPGAIPSTSAQPQQLINSPGVKKRRTQQMTQTVTAIVNALEQPPMAIEQQIPPTPLAHPSAGVYGADSLSNSLQQQQMPLGMGGPTQHHEQINAPSQCRIHVQNPPQTHGDFPPTGTKIQVVHMQPPAAAVSHLHQQMAPMSNNVPPQQQVGAASSRPDHHLHSSSSTPYDFHMGGANNTVSSEGIIHQNGPLISDLSATTELARHSSSRVAAAAAPPYSPYHQQQMAAFVSPAPQSQHHYYGNTMPQQLSPSTSYHYNNNQQQQLQHQTLQPPATGFKHPSQPSHGHFSPGNNFIAGHNNGRPYRTYPQHFARQQQQQMALEGCSPIPPHQPSSSILGGEHFPAQSPAAHPSTSSSPATAALLPGQSQHHQLLLQHQDGVTSPPIVTLRCTPPNTGGIFPQQQQQHQFMVPTAPMPQQQSQSYHNLQRYHIQQQQHPMGGVDPTASTSLGPQPIMIPQQQSVLASQPSSSHHVQLPSHQRFGAVLSPTPPPSVYSSTGAVVSSKVQPFFRNVAPASPFVCPAPPPVVLSQPPPMGSPLPQRAQLSRAQLLSRHSRDVEARKFAVKLYHLQRTIKALVYKNGALADELARLNQRICTVTSERKMLAKRLQHHERNRIRRIQSQYRKAIAAANNNNKQQQSNSVETLLDEFGGEGSNASQQKKS